MPAKIALMVVDIQNDFLPGGSLAVPNGDLVIPVVNEYVRRFESAGLPIYATRDWHPPMTEHFVQYGGVWPPHCVHGTPGAEFNRDLYLPPSAIVVSKGMDPTQDSYSAFQAFDADDLDMVSSLKAREIERIYIAGLATDYCVRSTVLDALRFGFAATALIDGCLGVNLQAHDSERAIADIVAAGGVLATLKQVLAPKGVATPVRKMRSGRR